MSIPSDPWSSGPAHSGADFAPSPPPPARPPVVLGEGRYHLRTHHDAGAQGEVWRAWDARLEREVAIKISLRSGDLARQRADREIAVIAGLEHPAVVPIHDCGVLEDGRSWFVMRWIEGRTLEALLRAGELHNLSRRLQLFVRVAEGLTHAHARGVIHRDIKPANIMVGPLGVVLIIDWGLVRGGVGEAGEAGAQNASAGTALNGVVGTPAYMAPEQARGEPVSAAADVWALGVLLGELIGGEPPWRGLSVPAILGALRRGEGPGVEGGPVELRELCSRALVDDPAARIGAEGLLRGVLDWLEGARREEEAMAQVAAATALAPRFAALIEATEAARAHLETLGAGLWPHADESEKAPSWEAEDVVEALEKEAAALRLERRVLLEGALARAPGLPAALDALADHHREEHDRAPHDSEAAGAAAEAVRRYDRAGRHRRWLEGQGRLHIELGGTMELRLGRYTPGRRRLVLSPVYQGRSEGLAALPLASGSYRLTLHRSGLPAVHLPVLLARGADLDLGQIELPDDLGVEDCFVSGGPFLAGAPPGTAPEALRAQSRTVAPFVARRFPVQVAEYARFLRETDLTVHAPRSPDGAPPRVGLAEEQGDLPVAFVDWLGASAYAEWYAQKTGLPWRLPTELEWEKAARGVDGRRYAWGPHFESTWGALPESSARSPSRAPVGSHPVDESPYGLFDTVGNVSELCADPYTRWGVADASGLGHDPDLRMHRGGNYRTNAEYAQVATRTTGTLTMRAGYLGFRLVRSV